MACSRMSELSGQRMKKLLPYDPRASGEKKLFALRHFLDVRSSSPPFFAMLLLAGYYTVPRDQSSGPLP